jgi:hypothetical protein
MKLTALAACILAGGLAATPPVTRAGEKPIIFSLSYTHAGLTEITLKNSKLHYVWHTDRQGDDGILVAVDSFENYDRHQIDVWLTKKEMKLFRNWVERHKVFAFEKDYPSASGGRTRGASFRSALTVVRGQKKHSVLWVGDSKVPKKLTAAIDELRAMASTVQKSRNK